MDKATAAVLAVVLLALACYAAIAMGMPPDLPFN
jgi:hypothetical protein